MGIAYNQANATESLSYGVYDWSLIQGAQGNTGVAGPAGADGQPRYTWVKYADSATGAGINDLPAGKTYIGFAYNKTSATESNVTTDYEWALIQGPQGSQGIQGPKGADGVQYYTWLKYADSPTTGMNDSPVGKTYMGIAYNKTSATESTLYGDYDWSLIVGPSGSQGVQGVAGPAGANGQPTYTWIKYATSALGAGINDSPVGMSYIGLAYNKSTAVESTVTTDYEWSLILGPQGPQGNTGATGPTGPPGLPGAATAPPASPALTLTPQDNGFVVQAGPIDIYSNLTYHCSTTTNFTPGAGTVVLANTRNQNVLITAQNGGAAFVRGTTYYFKVIEANNIGAAAASAQVSGQLQGLVEDRHPGPRLRGDRLHQRAAQRGYRSDGG